MLALPRRSRIVAVGLVGVFAATITSVALARANLSRPTVTAPPVAAIPQVQAAPAGLPTQLTIPAANIDAAIDPVGVTASGDMQAPVGPHTTTWYKLGPHPGNVGSAVIAGHYGRWKDGETSVFDTLNKLKSGDKVYVKDGAGAVATFVVRQARLIGRNDDAKEVFTSHDGKAHLNLITCQGTWDNAKKTYSDRLVVFTDLQ